MANSSWRLAMLLVPVLAIIFLLLTPVILEPMPKAGGGGIDYAGMIVIALGMIAFLFGVSQAGKGMTSLEFLIPTIGGMILFGIYYIVEKRSPHPIFPAGLFLKGAFAAAIVAGIGWNFAQAVVQLQTSNFWQLVQGFSTGQVALAQVMFMVAFGAGGVVVGKMIRPGNRMMWLIGTGFMGMAVSFVLLALVRPDTSYWFMAPVLFLFGVGLALVAVPQSTIFVSASPPKYLGPVTSFRTTAGQLGYALGFAASAGLLNAFANMELVSRLRESGLPDSQLGSAVDQVMLYISSGDNPSIAAARDAISTLTNDYAAGFNATMLLCAVAMVLIGAIVVLLLIIGKHQDREAAPRDEAQPGSDDAAEDGSRQSSQSGQSAEPAA